MYIRKKESLFESDVVPDSDKPLQIGSLTYPSFESDVVPDSDKPNCIFSSNSSKFESDVVPDSDKSAEMSISTRTAV